MRACGSWPPSRCWKPSPSLCGGKTGAASRYFSGTPFVHRSTGSMTCESAETMRLSIATALLEELAFAVHHGHALVLLRVARHRLAADVEPARGVLWPNPAADAHHHQRLLARGLEPVVRACGQHDAFVLVHVGVAAVGVVIARAPLQHDEGERAQLRRRRRLHR